MLPISDDLRRVLVSPTLVTDFGVNLLDDDDRPVQDISADVLSLSVSRDLHADIHGSCDITLTRDLRWGLDRVRPWFAVARSESGPWHRWNLGVYLLTSPEEAAGEEPRTRAVNGVDKLWLLDRPVGDTYVIPKGTSYLDAIRQVLTDAGASGGLLLDGDRQATTLADDAVWILTDAERTWLRVINDLLAMIGYRGLWVDEDGRFRSAPYQPPSEVGSVWTFDTMDVLEGIAGEDRKLSADVYDQPSYWRFVRKMDGTPTEGDGIYTVDRSAGVQYPRRKVAFLDAADQAALIAQGNAIVAEDTANTRLLSFDSSPLPLTHADVVTVNDPGLSVWVRAQVRKWTLTDDGSLSLEMEVLDG